MIATKHRENIPGLGLQKDDRQKGYPNQSELNSGMKRGTKQILYQNEQNQDPNGLGEGKAVNTFEGEVV